MLSPIGENIDWQQFHSFLLQRMTPKTAQDRMRYAEQYVHALMAGRTTGLLQLSPNKRIHVMKALSCLAKFTGMQDNWLAIRQKYGLQWSTGTEKIDAFTRFFDNAHTLDNMLHWLRQAIEALPDSYSRFLIFCTMTGLRGSEAIDAVRLLNAEAPRTGNLDDEEALGRTTQSSSKAIGTSSPQYYNPEQQILCHYLYPEHFIRRTKAVYVSVVNDEIIGMARDMEKPPTINGLKMAIKHRKLSMQLKYCRKIYASWLHKCGISDPLIDMLQGRIGKNIFLKHYLTPSSNYKAQVLQALEKLQCQL